MIYSLSYISLWTIILVTTSVAMTGLLNILPNSSVTVNGSTIVTCPPVLVATCPNSATLQSLPLIDKSETVTLQ